MGALPDPATAWNALLARPASRRRSLAIAFGATVGAIALTEGYSLIVGYLTVFEDYVGYLLLPAGLLGVLLLAARLEGRPLSDLGFVVRGPISLAVTFAAVLTLVYLAIRLDPGFFFGFGRTLPIPVWGFGFLLFSAPLTALAGAAFFFGYLFRTLARHLRFPLALVGAAGAYALYSTDLSSLNPLLSTGAIEYLFDTTMVAFVLGLVLALYYYKSEWSLVGPFTLLAAITATGFLLPVAARFPDWEVSFVAALAANAALLVVVGVGLREPRLQALRYLGERIGPRRFRFRNRARDAQNLRNLLVTGSVVGVVALTFGYGLPTVLGTPEPLLAIATGSMTPALPRGTLVVVEQVPASEIHVGTVIAFSVGCLPSPTVHRVIRIVEAGPNWVFQTKGDANHAQDPCTVPYSDVKGAVVADAPYVGYLVLDPLFAAALVVLILVVPMALREGRR
jgi:signal peptidase I